MISAHPQASGTQPAGAVAVCDPGGDGSRLPVDASLRGWRCSPTCGACCRLDPGERQEALAALDEDARASYLEMVGPDGWCRHFDTGSRRCRIYDERPFFCRVENLADLFAVPAEKAADFACSCCRQQIRQGYGGRSLEMRQFNTSIRRLRQR
ncbi:YkgJ family cysteine cluster protein [Synechococcus sp. RSCCF101]|nr:YkgJ family cysteine cluster protein [Synechococcus sp. RSCCF101]